MYMYVCVVTVCVCAHYACVCMCVCMCVRVQGNIITQASQNYLIISLVVDKETQTCLEVGRTVMQPTYIPTLH